MCAKRDTSVGRVMPSRHRLSYLASRDFTLLSLGKQMVSLFAGVVFTSLMPMFDSDIL